MAAGVVSFASLETPSPSTGGAPPTARMLVRLGLYTLVVAFAVRLLSPKEVT